jgi:hypothetical protein
MALDPQAEFAEYLKLSWKAFADGVAHAQTQLMTWLFTLQGAGVAGSLGYAASRGTPPSLIVSLIAFVFGILCLLMWGTVMYYVGTSRFNQHKGDVAKLEVGKLTRAQFIDNVNARSANIRSCECLAWLSGIAGLIGLISLIVAVVLKRP